jgi:hypothetical protein
VQGAAGLLDLGVGETLVGNSFWGTRHIREMITGGGGSCGGFFSVVNDRR